MYYIYVVSNLKTYVDASLNYKFSHYIIHAALRQHPCFIINLDLTKVMSDDHETNMKRHFLL